MTFKYSVLTLGLIFSLQAFAKTHAGSDHHKMSGDHKSHDHSAQKAKIQSDQKGKIVIKVKGMVCAFCAQGIEKNFLKQKQVKSTTVDLDTMEVTILLKKGKTLPESIVKKVVTDAGFGYDGVKL